MIKAEAIIHEGNPGPNWLDHCKNMVTPGKVALVVIVGAVLAGVLAYQNRQVSEPTTANKQPASSESQQIPLSPSQSLQVQPLNTTIPETSTGQPTDSLQSTPSNTVQGSSTSPSSSSLPSTAAPQAQNNASSKARQNVNQTLQGVQQTIQDTRNNVKNTLQGLGL